MLAMHFSKTWIVLVIWTLRVSWIGLVPVMTQQSVLMCTTSRDHSITPTRCIKPLECSDRLVINVTLVESSFSVCNSGSCTYCCAGELTNDPTLTTVVRDQCNDRRTCTTDVLSRIAMAKIYYTCIKNGPMETTTTAIEPTSELFRPTFTSTSKITSMTGRTTYEPVRTPSTAQSMDDNKHNDSFPVVAVVVPTAVGILASIVVAVLCFVIRKHKRLKSEDPVCTDNNLPRRHSDHTLTLINNIYGLPTSDDIGASPKNRCRNVPPRQTSQNTDECSTITRGPVVEDSGLYDHMTHHNNILDDETYSRSLNDANRNGPAVAAMMSKHIDMNIYDNANANKITDAVKQRNDHNGRKDCESTESRRLNVEYAVVSK